MAARDEDHFSVGDRTVFPKLGVIEGPSGETHVQPKVMAVLKALYARRGAVATRQEIMDDVWGGSFVSDESLTRCISELRSALGDNQKKTRLVRTIPKVGYCLEGTDAKSLESIEPEQLAALPSTHGVADVAPAELMLVAMLEFNRSPTNSAQSIARISGCRTLQFDENVVVFRIPAPSAILNVVRVLDGVTRGSVACGDVRVDGPIPQGLAIHRGRELLEQAETGVILVADEVGKLWPAIPTQKLGAPLRFCLHTVSSP